jgi:hypothetical protein
MQKSIKLILVPNDVYRSLRPVQKLESIPAGDPIAGLKLLDFPPRDPRTKSRFDLIDLQKAIDLAG